MYKRKEGDKMSDIGLLRDSILPQFKQDLEPAVYKVIKVYDNKIVIHNEYEKIIRKNVDNKNCLDNLKKRTYNGYMSDNTKRMLKRHLTAWKDSVCDSNRRMKKVVTKWRRKMVFVTLTLSSKQMHSDNEIKREVLDKFITKLKRETGVKHYFWKAESQKNGNIHFHLMVDHYIDHKKIREMWNSCQERLLYISEFEQNYKHRNPNSIDVRVVDNPKVAYHYLMGYVLKKEDNRKINGRIWGMSDKLREIDVYSCVVNSKVDKMYDELLKYECTKVIRDDHYTVVIYDDMVELKVVKRYLDNEISNYNNEIYNYLYADATHPYMIYQSVSQHAENEGLAKGVLSDPALDLIPEEPDVKQLCISY